MKDVEFIYVRTDKTGAQARYQRVYVVVNERADHSLFIHYPVAATYRNKSGNVPGLLLDFDRKVDQRFYLARLR